MPASPLQVLMVALGALAAPLAFGAVMLRPALEEGPAASRAPTAALLVQGMSLSDPCEDTAVVEVFVDDAVIRVAVHLYSLPDLDATVHLDPVERYALAPAMIPRNDEGWAALRDVLTELKTTDVFVDRSDIHVAVGGWRGAVVPYADLVRLLDVAGQAGFDRPMVQPVTTFLRPPPTRWRILRQGPLVDVC